MKNARIVVSAILAIGLLVTSAITVAAQEDVDEQTATSYVTGTFGEPRQTIQGSDSVRSGGLVEHRGYTWADITVDTDDPRLNGTMTINANGDERFFSGTAGSGEFTDLQALGVRITDDEGGWSGQGTVLFHSDGSTATTNLDTIILTGDGAYEGLTAYLLVDRTATPRAVEGTIFQGEMTPFPELPAE